MFYLVYTLKYIIFTVKKDQGAGGIVYAMYAFV